MALNTQENMYESLYDGIKIMLDCGDIEGIWVQKYVTEHEELWELSTQGGGYMLFTPLEMEGAIKIYDEVKNYYFLSKKERWLIEELETLVERRWREENTINICNKTIFRTNNVENVFFN